MTENIVVDQATPACATGLQPNCGECCTIFTDLPKEQHLDTERSLRFVNVTISVLEDVRDICARTRTLRQVIPCNLMGEQMPRRLLA